MNLSVKCRPVLFDLLAAALVLLLAALSFFGFYGGQDSGTKKSVLVSIDGEICDEFSPAKAGETRIYENNGYTLTVETVESDGVFGVCVCASDCPGLDCVHRGVITRSGESIVCLPARIVIRIDGADTADGGPDAVLG